MCLREKSKWESEEGRRDGEEVYYYSIQKVLNVEIKRRKKGEDMNGGETKKKDSSKE